MIEQYTHLIDVSVKVLQFLIFLSAVLFVAKRFITIYNNSRITTYLNLYNTLEQYATEAYTIFRISERNAAINIQEKFDEYFEIYKKICFDLMPYQYKKFVFWFSGDLTVLENRLYSYFIKFLIADNLLK